MFYLIGSEGFIGKKIQKIISKNNIVAVSQSGKKKIIKNDIIITKKINQKKNPTWVKDISSDDVVILLSNPGPISFYQNYPEKILNFEKNIEKFFFKKVNKDIKIIFLSSDMVYSGTKNYYNDSSNSNPLNNYGKSKKRIEKKIKKYFKNYLILRLCKIYSKDLNDKTMYSEIVINVKKKFYLELFNDQFVHYLDIKVFIKNFKLILKNLRILNGTFNFPSSTFCSRFQFAKKIIKKKEQRKYLIPIKTREKFKKIPLRLKMKTRLFDKIN